MGKLFCLKLVQALALTQHVGVMAQSTCSKLAITFPGGGFKSVAAQAGLLAGLLAANRRLRNGAINVKGSAILEKFDIVSGVSGGAWFSCELAYSTRFLQLIESMAYTPDAAGLRFDKDWIDGWLSIAEDNGCFVELLA